MPQPGFRWNIVDYGAGNVFADPLSTGKRCAGERTAWHCLWQRFPQQRSARTPPPVGSRPALAAEEVLNISKAGEMKTSMLQYVAIAGVTQVCVLKAT